MTAVTFVTFLLTRQYTKNPELCSLRCAEKKPEPYKEANH